MSDAPNYKHTKGVLVYAEEGRPLPEIATVARIGAFVVGIATPGYPGGDYRNIDCPDPAGEADAARMVLTWNAYDALLAALTPRQWSREMSDAWHRAIPDVEAAFAAIRELALKRGRS